MLRGAGKGLVVATALQKPGRLGWEQSWEHGVGSWDDAWKPTGAAKPRHHARHHAKTGTEGCMGTERSIPLPRRWAEQLFGVNAGTQCCLGAGRCVGTGPSPRVCRGGTWRAAVWLYLFLCLGTSR